MELSIGPVERVAYDRMAQGRKMNANLVGAAGVQLDFEQRRGPDACTNTPVCAGGARIAKQTGAIRAACRSDFISHCTGVQPGGRG